MNAPSSLPLLQLSGEDIAYREVVALRDMTLSIHQGEKVAVIGQSGAGKTTLLRRLYQLRPDECSFIHQNYALVSRLSTFHNIYMGRLDRYSTIYNLANLIRPATARVKEIRRISKKLGLENKLFTRIGELSGGQQQRVGIGRALYHGGSILMADEPVSSLDVRQSREIMELIVNAGHTVISSLHSIDLSQHFFQRIIGLKDNTILFDLPAPSLSEKLLAELYG